MTVLVIDATFPAESNSFRSCVGSQKYPQFDLTKVEMHQPPVRDAIMVKKGFETDATIDDQATSLAIEGLSFVASDTVLFNRFLRLTGLELENLRDAAGEPAFLAGVLDFIIGDETTLEEFAGHAGVRPQDVAAARRAFGTDYAESFS
jgi:hypothetical protein